MTKIGVIPEEMADLLAAPHVTMALLAELSFETATYRLHSGVGRLRVAGEVWHGVADPGAGRLVKISAIELPGVGVASVVTLVLTGADRDLIRSLRREASQAEGRPAALYWQAFEAGTVRAIGDPVLWFPEGTMSSPSFSWDGVGRRSISVNVEGIFSAKNFEIGGKYTSADQQRTYPEDKFFDFAGKQQRYIWPQE